MIIYKSINKINGKMYIGQTIASLKERKYKHKSLAKNNSQLYFHRAIRKYGWKNFKWEIIEEPDKEIGGQRETYYIKKFGCKSPNGYNLTDGNDNTTLGLRFEWTDEQKAGIIGKNNSNYGGGKWMIGKNNPAKRKSVREKISKSKIGKKRPDMVKIRAKKYIVKNISTGKEEEIYNMAEWIRNNSIFNYTGVKNVLKNEWKQYKGFHFRRI